MSGFKTKVGDFFTQFEEAFSKPKPLKDLSTKQYAEFFKLEGGPHHLEGFLPLGGEDKEYVNIRRTRVPPGEIIIEPVTYSQDKNIWIVSTNPNDIGGYRIKITGGKFNEESHLWDFESLKILEMSAGSEINKFHKELDGALRIKFSLAERLLNGEPVQAEIKTYRDEQTFYRGDFGKIVAGDPVKEPYLRDAFIQEIERVLRDQDHSGIRAIQSESFIKNKKEFELFPRSFMQARCTTAKITIQKLGEFAVIIFSDSKKGSDIKNQFELHGGRAQRLLELASVQVRS
jgi:hypothetical protein